MLRIVQTSAPAEPPVTLDEVKAHAVIEWIDDDEVLTGLRDAAIAHLDGVTGILGRCMVSQSWRQDLDCWPRSRKIRLPFPDVTSVTLTYFDSDNAEQTLSASTYEVLDDERSAFIKFGDTFAAPALYFDRSDSVKVAFTAGYGAAADVPATLKTAIKMLVARWYSNRGDSDGAAIPDSIWSIVAPFARLSV